MMDLNHCDGSMAQKAAAAAQGDGGKVGSQKRGRLERRFKIGSFLEFCMCVHAQTTFPEPLNNMAESFKTGSCCLLRRTD